MENNALPGLYRKVLGSPHSEQVIKAQIIQLASQNLHVPEVTTALLSAQNTLSEPERITVQQTLNSLPAVSPETALEVLAKNSNAPNILQLQAVELAEKCATWGPELVNALQPYLDVKTDRDIRFRILNNYRQWPPAFRQIARKEYAAPC